jgi:quinolinate synthase
MEIELKKPFTTDILKSNLISQNGNSKISLADKIKQLKKEKNAVILAHYYQVPEIQDAADFIGDSLQLAMKAAETKASIIVFAGVHFMAETAKILNPEKKVLIPDLEAGCSLADNCPEDKFKAFVNAYPDHYVVSYVNCSAGVKALSDIICTSSNAVNIVKAIPKHIPIIFAPDKNLGKYVMKESGRNDMILWDGTCIVHEEFSADQAIHLKSRHPKSKILAHPECGSALLEAADFTGSTSALLNFVKTDPSPVFIIATESGILYQMIKEAPHKQFISAPPFPSCTACQQCPYMKMNTLEKIYLCLLNENPEVLVDKNIAKKALIPVQRMVEFSKGELVSLAK